MTRNKYGAVAGWRDDIGIYTRSKMEANYARYLNLLIEEGRILGWEYEPMIFYFNNLGYKTSPVSYKPDFFVKSLDGTITVVECKGLQTGRDRSKWSRYLKHVAQEDDSFLVVGPNAYTLIWMNHGEEIPCWE